MYKSPANFFFENILEKLEVNEQGVVDFLFEGSLEKYNKFKNNEIILDEKLAYNLSILTFIEKERWLSLQEKYLRQLKHDI